MVHSVLAGIEPSHPGLCRSILYLALCVQGLPIQRTDHNVHTVKNGGYMVYVRSQQVDRYSCDTLALFGGQSDRSCFVFGLRGDKLDHLVRCAGQECE
jgi:hypothetical protein